jgi:hypothetical protein
MTKTTMYVGTKYMYAKSMTTSKAKSMTENTERVAAGKMS